MFSQLSDSALIALGLIIILVITVNLGLWAAWKRKNAQNQFNWLQGLSHSVRNPWHKEDEQIQKLSAQVKELKRERDITQNSTSSSASDLPAAEQNEIPK